MTLADGLKIATPLARYPRLRDANATVRGHFESMPMGIHWPDLDEDLGIAGICGAARLLDCKGVGATQPFVMPGLDPGIRQSS